MFCYQALQLGQADEKLVKLQYLNKYYQYLFISGILFDLVDSFRLQSTSKLQELIIHSL